MVQTEVVGDPVDAATPPETLVSRAENKRLDPACDEGRGTQDTWFQSHVQSRSAEPVPAQCLRSQLQYDHLCMAECRASRFHFVACRGENLSVFRKHCADRHFALY